MTLEMNIAASVRNRACSMRPVKAGVRLMTCFSSMQLNDFYIDYLALTIAAGLCLRARLMFIALKMETIRPTRDIDLLGYTPNDVEKIVELMQEICSQQVEPDGLFFDPETVRGLRI